MNTRNYLSKKYLHNQRIYAYIEQYKYIKNGMSIIEIGGAGSGFKDLAKKIANYASLDRDPLTKPDYVLDISKSLRTEFKKTFDIVFCCQVLEHIQFKDLDVALDNIFGLSHDLVVISIPDNSKAIGFGYALTTFCRKKIFSVPFTGKQINISNHPEHYWELNRQNYREIKSFFLNIAKKNKFSMDKNYRLYERPYQRFLVFRKDS